MCDDPPTPEFWEDLWQVRRNFDPAALPPYRFLGAHVDCLEHWDAILPGEVERNPAFRAYLGTSLALCEGQAFK
jgi:hypothetical protein